MICPAVGCIPSQEASVVASVVQGALKILLGHLRLLQVLVPELEDSDKSSTLPDLALGVAVH